MPQTSAMAAPGQVGAAQAGRRIARSNMLENAIRRKYKAVRSATAALAESMSAKWH
jgi:hypothetical protein